MKKIFILFILFFLFICFAAAEVMPLPDLSRPDFLAVDNTELYIAEMESIYIYSLADFKLKKKFGRVGEGPREFNTRIMELNSQSDILTVTSMGKVSFFKKDGTFIKEKKLTSPFISNVTPLGDGFVCPDYAPRRYSINLFNSKLEKIKKLCSSTDKYGPEKPGEMYRAAFEFRVYGDKIFIATDKNFVIDVYNAAGNQVNTIKQKYRRLKFTGKHRDQIFEEFKKKEKEAFIYKGFKKVAKFPGYFPAIKKFFVTGNKIYVQTYKIKDNRSEFYILDIGGRLLKALFLPLADEGLLDSAKFTIYNGKLYHLYENEEEEQWEIRVIAINQLPL